MRLRGFPSLPDSRLVKRGEKIYRDLFCKTVHSVRGFSDDEAAAKGAYRFFRNERVTEESIILDMQRNCQAVCKGKNVICIQDTTEVNLSSHRKRIKKDNFIGTTNANNTTGLGYLLHPSLVLDADDGMPYGYADVKVWNRPLLFKSKKERNYNRLPIEEKESYKWIEVSNSSKQVIGPLVKHMVIVQDREGDIYEQFATIPDKKTDLLIRARANRLLKDKTKLFTCLETQAVQGEYKIEVLAKKRGKKRTANMQIRYKEVEITKGRKASVKLWLVEAKETGYTGADEICWRLLTTIRIEDLQCAKNCLEWYSWRWTVEEVFKIMKKEGYNIEGSELEYASSVRKMSLMIMEVVIQLFLMRIAYAEPEHEIPAEACFTKEEQEFFEQQITHREGKTEKQKNPHKVRDLKRYVWVLARMGGWKGYESKRHPGITTLWMGLKYFKAAFEGYILARNVSTR